MKGKMNKNSIILAVIVGVLVVTTLCTGLVVANRRQPVITLSDSAIEMDVTDTYALDTEIENPRKDVVWKSADESVATVTDKGVVTALKEGKTEVTVTSGKTTASCAVSVTDSQSAPRIELDYNNVAIGLDYSFTVTPKMMWKGKEVKEDIAYTWALGEDAEEGVASIEQKGNSATITGLKYGETAFTVSTTYRDTVLVKTIKVCVTDIDVMFDSPNMEMSAGCFRVNLGLVATEKDVTSIVPEIRVYDKEELVANPTFTWSNSDESIAVRDSKTGRISAKKAGETEITGLYKDSKLLIRVNVYRPEITINPLYVEAIKNYVISSDKWSGMNVESVTFSGKEVMKATHKSGKNIQLDEEKLPAVGTSGTLIVQTEKVKYVADSMVVTMAISSESDLNKMASAIKSNKGAGYYALTNDITCKGTYDSGLEVEFIGTFDGCGYNIANMTTADKESSTRGLLGKSLGADGVVKNVSFTNAKHGGQGAFIATNAAGRIENVYIQIDITDCSTLVWDSATAVLVCNTFGVFQTKSVIVEYMNALPTDATTGYPLWQLHYGYAKHQGLFAIGTDKVAASENDLGAGLKDIYAAYVNYGEFSDAGNDVSTWDESFWTMTNGIPYPKNLGTRKGTVPKVSLPQYVGTGSTVSIDGLTVCDKVIVNSTMKKYGITVKNGALVIPKNVPSGLTLSITVQSAFDASKKATIQTTVLASEAVSISDVCAVEIYNVKKFEVDLSSKANILKGATLTDLTIDGKAVTGVTYRDNKITMDASALGELGEKTMIAYFKSNSKLYIVTVTVDACTLAIRTEADLNKLGSVINENNGDGRYVLAADIVCKGTYDSNTTVEFNGTFEGHGYAIYNMTTSDRTGANRGLIGRSLGSNGVVKNVSFLNAKHSGQGAFIATTAAGKMENLYIQITVTDCTADSYDGATSVLASSTFGSFNTNNVLIEYSDTLPDGAKNGYAVWQLYYGYAKHQNLYVVGEKKVATTESDLGAGLKDVYGAYTNYGEYIKAGNSTDTWDSSFWGFTNGVPYPKHLGTRAGDVPNVTMSQYTGAGEKLELVGLTICDNAVLDAATQKLGVTLKNSTITIPKNVPLGSAIRVTVSSAFDSAKAKVLTAKVMASKSVTLDGVYFAEKYDKTTFAIDLGNKAIAVEGKQVISATLESKAFKTVSYNDGVVTLDTNSLSGLGEKTVTILFMGQNELVTVTATVDVCTMAIRNEDDLNRMGSVIMANNGAGRYVLANDITCAGTYNSNVTVGFTGTFDGRGYVIYNMTTAAGETSNRGLLGKSLDSAGVLQNVSFVNAKHSGNGGFIAQDAAGLIQDVYIQISLSDITTSTSVLATSTLGVFQNEHVVVEYTEALPAGAAGGYAVGQLYYGYAKHQGLYVVGADKVAAIASDLGGGLKDVYRAFMTYADFLNANIDFSSWKGDFWTVIDGVPYPAKLADDFATVNASISDTVKAGSSTAISGMNLRSKVILSDAAEKLGVTVENNKLVVPSNVAVDTEIKFTVQSVFDSSKKVELSTKVTAAETKLKEISWSNFGATYGTTYQAGANVWDQYLTLQTLTSLNNTKFKGDVILSDNTTILYGGAYWNTGLCIAVENGTFKVSGYGITFKTTPSIEIPASKAKQYGLKSFVNTRFTLEIKMTEWTEQKAVVNISLNGYPLDTVTLESQNYSEAMFKLGTRLSILGGSVQTLEATPNLQEISWSDFGATYGTTYQAGANVWDQCLTLQTLTSLNNTKFKGDVILSDNTTILYGGAYWNTGLCIAVENGTFKVSGYGITFKTTPSIEIPASKAKQYGLKSFVNTRFTLEIKMTEWTEQKAVVNISLNGYPLDTVTLESQNYSEAMFKLGTRLSILGGSVQTLEATPDLQEISWSDFGATYGTTYQAGTNVWDQYLTLQTLTSLNNTRFKGDVILSDNTTILYGGAYWNTGLCIAVENGTFKVSGYGITFKTTPSIEIPASKASEYDLTSFVNTRFALEIKITEWTEQKAVVNISLNGYPLDTVTLESQNYNEAMFKLGTRLSILSGSVQTLQVQLIEEIQTQLQTTSAIQNLSKRMQLVVKTK